MHYEVHKSIVVQARDRRDFRTLLIGSVVADLVEYQMKIRVWRSQSDIDRSIRRANHGPYVVCREVVRKAANLHGTNLGVGAGYNSGRDYGQADMNRRNIARNSSQTLPAVFSRPRPQTWHGALVGVAADVRKAFSPFCQPCIQKRVPRRATWMACHRLKSDSSGVATSATGGASKPFGGCSRTSVGRERLSW